MAKKKIEEEAGKPVEAADKTTSTEETPKRKAAETGDSKPAGRNAGSGTQAANGSAADAAQEGRRRGKRAEKVGVVYSDKMTNTVVVRVDRLVKHSMYRKFIKKRKKFMAHDELGAGEGDKVRIVETRPLSAKKRWRVVEIIQKAKK